MKKLSVLLVVVMASVASVSAQSWGVGGRLSYGAQAVGQYVFPSQNYIEARLGLGWNGNFGPEISFLHYWNVKNWDWTSGNWFLDIGAGANTVISKNHMFLGAQAVGKFGYTFEDFPLSLSADFSPAFGPNIGTRRGYGTTFWAEGLFYNAGISCVYRF
jgi:hypothetical protein